MSGFYVGPIQDSLAERQEGLDIVPSSTGEVLGATWDQAGAEMIGPRLWTQVRRSMRDTGYFAPPGGMPWRIGEPAPTITAEEANKDYTLPGMQKFTAPVSRETAHEIFEEHQRRLERESIIGRRNGGVMTGQAAQFLTSVVSGLRDPVNLAASFIPVAPAAKVAAALAAQGGMLGRAGVRAGIGAASGAAGAAILEPVNYGLMQQEQSDWTMGTAAMNVALGAAMGGVLHTGFGAVSDIRALRGADAGASALDSVTESVRRMAPESREAAMRQGIDDLTNGRAVHAEEIARAAELARMADDVQARAGRLAAMEADAPLVAEVRTIADGMRGGIRQRGAAPVSMLEFIGERGGVQEQGGDLRAIGADKHFVPGQGRIVRRTGMTLDYAREAAEEAGYLRPNSTIADFLDAVAEEVAGRRVFLPHEVAAAAERRAARVADRDSDRMEDYRTLVRSMANEYGERLSDADADHAAMLTMDGMHPDEAIRAATLGEDLRVSGLLNEIRGEADSIRVQADLDSASIDRRLEQLARDIDALRAFGEPKDGSTEAQFAALDKMQTELDTIIASERAGARLSADQERMLRDLDAAAKEAEGTAKAIQEAGFCAATRGG